MSGELFRQDGKSKGERAVVQGEDGSKLNRKSHDGASVGEQAEKQRHEGPLIDVDSYNDRFERAEPGVLLVHEPKPLCARNSLRTYGSHRPEAAQRKIFVKADEPKFWTHVNYRDVTILQGFPTVENVLHRRGQSSHRAA